MGLRLAGGLNPRARIHISCSSVVLAERAAGGRRRLHPNMAAAAAVPRSLRVRPGSHQRVQQPRRVAVPARRGAPRVCAAAAPAALDVVRWVVVWGG